MRVTFLYEGSSHASPNFWHDFQRAATCNYRVRQFIYRGTLLPVWKANSNRWLCLVIKFISTWNLAWQKFQCINNRFLFCVRNWNTMPSTLTLWICTITSVEQNRIFTTFFVSLTPFSKPEDFSFPISEQNQVI